MFRFLLMTGVMSLLNVTYIVELFADEIHWTTSPQIAVDKAYGSGRMILISVHTQSCQFCKKMEQEVWRNPDVEQIVNRDLVPLKLNDQEHAELIKKLEVTSYPTTFIFSTERVPLAKLDGFVSATDLRAIIEVLKDRVASAVGTATN